jgi:hypothetical protein
MSHWRFYKRMRKYVFEWEDGILVHRQILVELLKHRWFVHLSHSTFLFNLSYSLKVQKKNLQFQNCFLHIRLSSKTTSPTYFSRKAFNLWSFPNFCCCRCFVLRVSISINNNSPYSENSPSARNTFAGKEANQPFVKLVVGLYLHSCTHRRRSREERTLGSAGEALWIFLMCHCVWCLLFPT